MMNQNIQDLQRKEINLYFSYTQFGGKPPTCISCFTDEKISEVIKRYKNMSKIDLNIESSKFMYNARPLDPNKTFEESGIRDSSCIVVFDYSKILRGG